ncbi:phosphotransferase [Candidatus Gracilibacteria bacterium]|nr:phosphotransferase [Candidatus Gracilibacteria bacterium]NJM86591.1 phosphotransferase [Hydrococcus sp. RU_2_2]NJP18865.1 phosphotransferase [Hydrococcus sp. CRU_1_1]NJQ97833.1 phosphotransferase [Hydrococcus sp. CSU_1_8]
MQVLSPYGKDVLTELKDIYGFSSIAAATEFIIHHIKQQYQFQVISIESLHIGYGLVAKLKADGEIYHLKLTLHERYVNSDQLFPWLDYARKQGILLPEIIPASDGSWYLSPLKNVELDYDVIYLMRDVPGKPMKQASKQLLQQYAEAMAQFHRIGFEYSHPVLGAEDWTWESRWKYRHDLQNDLKDCPFVSQELVAESIRAIAQTRVCTLPKTIIHKDFWFCHVFFQDNSLSGIVDVDMSTQGERLLDLCIGLTGSSSPARGSFLTFEQLQDTLSMYHQCLPLNEAEKSVFKGVLVYAFLDTLNDIFQNNATERDINITQSLLSSILQVSEKELLGSL